MLFHEGAKESSLVLNFKLTMNDIRSVVPNVFGTGHQFHGRQFFHGLGVEGWFWFHPLLTSCLVPNRSWTSTHLWPRDWGTLLDSWNILYKLHLPTCYWTCLKAWSKPGIRRRSQSHPHPSRCQADVLICSTRCPEDGWHIPDNREIKSHLQVLL